MRLSKLGLLVGIVCGAALGYVMAQDSEMGPLGAFAFYGGTLMVACGSAGHIVGSLLGPGRRPSILAIVGWAYLVSFCGVLVGGMWGVQTTSQDRSLMVFLTFWAIWWVEALKGAVIGFAVGLAAGIVARIRRAP